MDKILSLEEVSDFKSQLQEKIQETHKVSPVYTVTHSEGPDHARIFEIEVTAASQVLGKGTGKSKLEAEQLAAKAALEKLVPNNYNP